MGNQEPLRNNLAETYLFLRRSMSVLAIAFPVVLALGGYLHNYTILQGSLSAYYYTGMRNIFVGILCTIGTFLILYRGDHAENAAHHDRLKNWVLNFAGLFAVGIALFPADITPGTYVKSYTTMIGGIHTFCAIAFFAAIATVCIRLSEPDPCSSLGENERNRYRLKYRICGAVMLISIFIALLVMVLPDNFKPFLYQIRVIFWVETFAITAFSFYWYFKSEEIDQGISWIPFRKSWLSRAG